MGLAALDAVARPFTYAAAWLLAGLEVTLSPSIGMARRLLGCSGKVHSKIGVAAKARFRKQERLVQDADLNEAAGAADTAWAAEQQAAVAEVRWGHKEGGSCDPFTQADAGRTPAA